MNCIGRYNETRHDKYESEMKQLNRNNFKYLRPRTYSILLTFKSETIL